MTEHPFAPFVRILGKGPRLSRPLTFDETRTAAGMILRGEVEPLQLGAFLCLLRVKTETPDEMAGFAMAIRDLLAGATPSAPVDIDWPSYAGKARRSPLFILSALLLAQNGLRIAMHGSDGHTANRLYTRDAFAALGLPVAGSLTDAADHLAQFGLTYVPLEALHPRLPELMSFKPLLGLRSPLHSVLRHVNPFGAKLGLISVFHPNYRAVHRDAAALLGDQDVACFKGDGGEIERRPEKPCLLEGCLGGQTYSEEWPALMPPTDHQLPLDPSFLVRLWTGAETDPIAEMIVTATAALALRLTGRAASPDAADGLARQLWQQRRLAWAPGNA